MEYLIWQCQAAIDSNGGVLLSLLVAGLLGSINHCAGMCGPFVVAQVGGSDAVDRANPAPGVLKRLQAGALLPYHLGRLTTYVFLGVVGASLSQFIVGSPLQRMIAVVLLFLAGVLFLFSALPQLKQLFMLSKATRNTGTFFLRRYFNVGNVIGKAARPFFLRRTGAHQYALGILLGFMPCALVVAAIMAVTATGAPVTAVLGMALFGLGTIPALVGVGMFAKVAQTKWPQGMQKISTGMMAVNGAGLMILAGGMVK